MHLLKIQQARGQLPVHRKRGAKSCGRTQGILVDHRMDSLEVSQIIGQGLCIATKPESEGGWHGHLHMGITGH